MLGGRRRTSGVAGLRRDAVEEGALAVALTRIRAGGEGWAAAQAERAFRQVLGAPPRPDLARDCLERIAAGPDPRAALLAAPYSVSTTEAGWFRK